MPTFNELNLGDRRWMQRCSIDTDTRHQMFDIFYLAIFVSSWLHLFSTSDFELSRRRKASQ